MIRRTDSEFFRTTSCPHCGQIVNYGGRPTSIIFVSATTSRPLIDPSPKRQILPIICPSCKKEFKERLWVKHDVIVEVTYVNSSENPS